MADTTIVYYTDNSISPELMKMCQENISYCADGKPIISVSQKPIEFGTNTSVGEIGRSHLSLFKQILYGVMQVKTKYVALAEHDCLYTKEHFEWTPPKDDTFFYNVNHWFYDMNANVFSYYRRKVLSMMIADTELTKKAAKDKVDMITLGLQIKKGQPGACEFGVCDNRTAYTDLTGQLLKEFGKDIVPQKAEAFRTVNPCLDIRHGKNFSGGRRGKDTCDRLNYWGSGKDVMKYWGIQ